MCDGMFRFLSKGNRHFGHYTLLSTSEQTTTKYTAVLKLPVQK